MEEIRSYKIDKKDFVKWTGYGGRYINRLLETLNDIEVTGEAEADEFHLKALQAIMVNHFAGFISVNSLQRK